MRQSTPYVGQVGTGAEVRKSSLCLDSLLKLSVLYTSLYSLRMTLSAYVIFFSVSSVLKFYKTDK